MKQKNKTDAVKVWSAAQTVKYCFEEEAQCSF
jgi:hypothetical protein